MKTYSRQPETKSDTAQPKASRQASAHDVLQAYKDKIVQRQEIDEDELLQGQFSDTAQREEFDEDELLQGKFETAQREVIDEEELLQGKFDSSATVQKEETAQPPTENRTGMPDNLKSGIESLSGYSMDDVRVHYNSSKPAQLQALAYAQGTDIHIAPGQEQHLPHEAWHVVQQKQGRVQPTMQLQGVNVNDNEGLEKEADVMGENIKNQSIKKNEVFDRRKKYIRNSSVFQMVREYVHFATKLDGRDMINFIEAYNEEGILTAASRGVTDGQLPDGTRRLEHHKHIFMWDDSKKGLDNAATLRVLGKLEIKIRHPRFSTFSHPSHGELKVDSNDPRGLGYGEETGAWAYKGDIPRKYIFIEGVDKKSDSGYDEWFEGKGWPDLGDLHFALRLVRYIHLMRNQ
jgi:hypothetical protein